MTSRTPATKERIWEMQRDRKKKRRKVEREREREREEGGGRRDELANKRKRIGST